MRAARVDMDEVPNFARDELAVKQGHHNASAILEPTRRRLLTTSRRGRGKIRTFFELPECRIAKPRKRPKTT